MDFILYYLLDLLANTAIYLAFTVPAFLVCWHWMAQRWASRRIQPVRRSSPAVLQGELWNSGLTLAVFAALDTALYAAERNGLTQIYTSSQEHGLLYLVLSVPLVIILHDTWFYWVHRAMHHPALFRHMHRVHHVSVDPSPFTSYSFHPLEALAEGSIYVLVAFALPVHVGVLLIWQLFQLLMNVSGHLGYEVFPPGANRHWVLRHAAPVTHHNLHHSRFTGNYGLYFTWWDRWMGTEFKDYHQVFDTVQQRIRLAGTRGD